MTTNDALEGYTIQVDRSGMGHNWLNVDASDLPSDVRQELEGEIIDGKQDEGQIIASNGMFYRWF